MNTPVDPSFQRVPARQGLAWLVQSLVLIRSQSARLLFLAVLLQLIIGLSQVPLLGVLVVLAVPGMTAGILEAFHRAARGEVSPASVLFQPLTTSPLPTRWLLLGAVLFLVATLCSGLVLSGEQTELNAEWMARVEQGDTAALQEIGPETLFRVGLALMLAVGVSGTLSFLAIPLIWFGRVPLGPALWRGQQALLANWAAFLMLGLGLAALALPLMVLLGVLFQLAGSVSGMALVAAILLMLAALLFQLTVFGSQYAAYREIFELDSGSRPKPTDQARERDDREDDSDSDDSQLLA